MDRQPDRACGDGQHRHGGNALTKYLNVKSGRLLDEYHVRYENRAKHSGRQVKLTYMAIDNVEYEVIE